MQILNYKKQYVYGDCIYYSVKKYRELKREGYKPLIVEGYAEVDIANEDVDPNTSFLDMFFPEELKKLEKEIYYTDYPKVFQHTWVICNGKIYDVTKNQFKNYGGIIRYYGYVHYWYNRGKEIERCVDETYTPLERR